MSSSSDDVLTELLISQLLEQDLHNLASLKEAEKLQLDHVLATSARAKGCIPKFSKTSSSPELDCNIALEFLAADARVQSDGAYAQSLQLVDDASATASLQYAQSLAASEKKMSLDAEFARRLQSVDDGGEMDVDEILDAEGLLGKEVVERILASDPNDKGKGTKRELSSGPEPAKKFVKVEQRSISIKTEDGSDELLAKTRQLTCGICLEPFQPTHSPISASLSANSSSRLQFGMRLPCPNEHAYCISCLTTYIQTKLDPGGEGCGNVSNVVFPIRCPECPIKDWVDGIQDNVADRILGEKGMVLWHRQKLLDSIPRYYCPNPRCSALVQVHEDPDEPQGVCPSCQEAVCVPCRTTWHEGLSCEEYQALPADERSPEDQLVLKLAQAKNWRRCPSCAVIVELTHGCNHITCPCGTHFCFKCGSLWDTKCTRNPSCELWDEDILLEERERQREEQAPQPALPPPPPPPYALNPVVPRVLPGIDRNNFDWIDDPNIICGRHWFTTGMVQKLTCGYCDIRLNSLADLRYHLGHVRRHPVYACCGRFFKRDIDLQRHVDSYPRRFGAHIHTIRRD